MSAQSTAVTAKKVRPLRGTPSEQSLNVARYASERVNGRDATVRRRFVRSEPPGQRTPLSLLLSGGQGGEVRLKLYLSMLFIAVAAPYSTEFPARAWAELLDLPDPATAGSRRVRDALDWLHEHAFVRVERRPGRESEVFLLSDEGTGDRYELVSKEKKDVWLKIPESFWSRGWVAALSGRAIATLLVLIDFSRLVDRSDAAFWIAPQRARELYALSAETLARGTQELVAYGVVTTAMKYLKDSPLASIRRRKEYQLDMPALAGYPNPT